ncbi:hypothetical protein D4764_05G0003910 [Takifugu flavidus]|uniref:Uncharacterized protein n=1 Tax=Takifugu flavidus TaxID=433684 RepID=A0A5C6N1T7_9TELE|nr:hypothetical protein D4764_05G0003910 [Takifugu flavidus]
MQPGGGGVFTTVEVKMRQNHRAHPHLVTTLSLTHSSDSSERFFSDDLVRFLYFIFRTTGGISQARGDRDSSNCGRHSSLLAPTNLRRHHHVAM